MPQSDWNQLLDDIGESKPLSETDEETQANPEEIRDDRDNSVGEPNEEKDVKDPPKEEDEELPDDEEEEEEEEKGPEAEPEADEDDTDDEDEKPKKPDDEEAPEEDEEEPTFEVDGEEVTLDQVRQWKNQGLMEADYRKKTAQLAEQRRGLQESLQSNRELASNISKDPNLREFLKAHPEGLEYLLADPGATSNLIGNAQAVEDFWVDYETLSENPRLAEKLVEKGDGEEVDEVTQEIQRERQTETISKIVTVLGNTVDAIGKEYYPDVDPDEVKHYLVELSGIPKDPTFEHQQAGAARLWQLFFGQDPQSGEIQIDPRLIGRHFERLQAKGSPDEDDADAETHNKKVDEKLKDDTRPPKTPKGDPPSPEDEKPKRGESFRDQVDMILEGV